MRKKSLYWLLQIVGWLVYLLLTWFINRLNGAQLSWQLILNLFAILVLGIINTHLYRSVIIKFDWLRKKLLQIIPRVFIASVLFGIVIHFEQKLIADFLIAGGGYKFHWLEMIQRIINWTAIFILWTLLYFLAHFIRNYKKEEIKNLQWEATRNEMELNKLKSQLNPHFLFNSMNSIRALVEENPEKAKTAITQLSTILRSSMLMGRYKVIDFSEEIKLVEDYLALEKIRFEDRLKINLDISPESYNFKVPPLMVQTLVENAIKHGISKRIKGGNLHISARVEEKKLHICIKNEGKLKQANQDETGFGLKNTAQRLLLLYGEDAKFKLLQEKNEVTACIIIPQFTQNG